MTFSFSINPHVVINSLKSNTLKITTHVHLLLVMLPLSCHHLPFMATAMMSNVPETTLCASSNSISALIITFNGVLANFATSP